MINFFRVRFSFWFTVYLLLILWCWTVRVQRVNPDESSKMMSLSKGWSDEYRIALTKYIWVNNVWTELLTSSKHFWDLGKDQISEFNSQMSKTTLRIPCLPNINKDTIDKLFKWIQWISLYLKCSIINLFNVVTDHILRIHPQDALNYKSQVQPQFRLGSIPCFWSNLFGSDFLKIALTCSWGFTVYRKNKNNLTENNLWIVKCSLEDLLWYGKDRLKIPFRIFRHCRVYSLNLPSTLNDFEPLYWAWKVQIMVYVWYIQYIKIFINI